MNSQDKETQIYVDDVSGVLFGINNSKIVFEAIRADGSEGGVDPEQESIRVATLVIPTNNLLDFCIFTLKRFVAQKEFFEEVTKSSHAKFEETLNSLAAVEMLKPEKPVRARRRSAKSASSTNS
ncbi:hypothetical protein ACQUJO_16985 [Ralstonia pseudosolanacearum]